MCRSPDDTAEGVEELTHVGAVIAGCSTGAVSIMVMNADNAAILLMLVSPNVGRTGMVFHVG